MALTPATTLGDGSASWRALKANLSGVGLALVMSAGVGLFVQAAANVPAIGSRVQLSSSDVLLALASGVAAA
ncbi:MAG TPA: TIGR00341 family protein, partial [Verrucomicrobiales bacterium]|nr:TIGR00341 family protein [Verrucomicrobiales bacterium]